MKARVIETGEIVEVERINHRIYGRIDGGTALYRKDMLDFNPDLYPPQPEATISGWICRDKDGELTIFGEYPERDGDSSWWLGNVADRSGFLIIDSDLFPSLTWQDDPLEIEIIIKPKKI